MDNTLDKEENAKNIYVIRHKLADLKPIHGRDDRWEYTVGNFCLIIFGYEVGDVPAGQTPNLVRCDKLDVHLSDKNKDGALSSISLRDDPRFSNYEPIQYNVITTPGGTRINRSNGHEMPILHLCELIRYLHRLSNLTAFM